MPECRINLAHLVAYLAEAPKSTRSYEAYKRAEQLAKEEPTLPVPMQVRNAPTKLMKELGYGDEYRYNPDYAYVGRLILWTLLTVRQTPGRKYIRTTGGRGSGDSEKGRGFVGQGVG